jgi:aryl-alcohol dehydrogenase-like predicted oxidoreductase
MEMGVNTFDTAETYGHGTSEELLGGALRQYKRDDFVVITKVAPWNLGYEKVIKAANQSLERLGLREIDLYLIHYPNPLVRMKETALALERLVKEGKVLHIGASNFNPFLLRRFQEDLRREEVTANEIEYNIVSASSRTRTIPYCVQNKIGVIAFSPLAGGILSGAFTAVNVPKDRAHAFNFAARSSFVDRMPRLFGVLNEIAERRSTTMAQVALAWITSQEPCVAIPAALTPSQASENADAGDLVLTQQETSAMDEAAPQVGRSTYAFDHYIIRPISWIRAALTVPQAASGPRSGRRPRHV